VRLVDHDRHELRPDFLREIGSHEFFLAPAQPGLIDDVDVLPGQAPQDLLVHRVEGLVPFDLDLLDLFEDRLGIVADKFLGGFAQLLMRSISGTSGLAASCSTRSLNESQEISLLMNFFTNPYP
jgi:hypothetical protein